MNRIRFCFFALFFLVFFAPLLPPLFAAEAVSLSLEDAVGQALDHSLNLKKDAIDLAQTEYSAGHLWSEIFPSFSLSAGLNFLPSTPLFTDPGFAYRDEALSYSLNFGLSLSLNASARSSMKSIELAYRTELLSYENARRQLEIQVTKNFLSLIAMKDNITFMEESLVLAEQKMEQARVARENGLVNEITWLNSRFSAESARFDLLSARGTYQNALGEFLALLGMESGTDIDFDGTVEIVPVTSDPERLIFEYLPKRPDIINQRLEIERLEYGKTGTALSSRAPSLRLSTQWNGGSPNSNSQGLGGRFTDSLSGSLTLTIPVDSWIPGTQQNQELKAADAELEKAKLDLESTETSAKTQIRSLVSNLNNTWESVGVARMGVEIAQRTAEAAEAAFQGGALEFQGMEDAHADLADARQRLLQGELSYKNLLLDLAAALNIEWETLTAMQSYGGNN